ncbi:alpha/beta hydrolase [Streptomyces sp. CA-210063]|uniref:esterase/lipase family protein n=1 Tax=Streptomyces sp. CA-210063 TaxID=2801029 RepID=UPI00214BBF20|nr:alpha/beta hydrolase [Streptomyces sp. CA-210063]UUU33139.1 alpha/beta hydrolase [Streptomyces sp. CA-210063]
MAIAFASATPASAAPGRSNSEGTVIFIHGYAWNGHHDCTDYFKKARTFFKNKHWDGNLYTYGYYRGNSNCSYNYKGSRNTSLNEIAKAFAQRIAKNYEANHRKVDIVAHSMGGLIVRTMLRHVALKGGKDGWPRRLYIEDVVTLGTPHDGTSWAEGCDGFRQCRQMEPGSDFIKTLGEGLYRSDMDTDWTLISSFDDGVVSEGSGVGANSQHKIQYRNLPNDDPATRDHNSLTKVDSGWHTARIKHSRWSGYAEHKAPLERARLAVYQHSAN